MQSFPKKLEAGIWDPYFKFCGGFSTVFNNFRWAIYQFQQFVGGNVSMLAILGGICEDSGNFKEVHTDLSNCRGCIHQLYQF